MAENPKAVFGRSKVCSHFVPPIARAVEAIVMALGARKYGPFNWRRDPVRSTDYIDAIQRHLDAWADGEDLDPESRVSHLGHVRACCAILLDAEANGKLIDDRHKSGAVADFFERLSDRNKCSYLHFLACIPSSKWHNEGDQGGSGNCSNSPSRRSCRSWLSAHVTSSTSRTSSTR